MTPRQARRKRAEQVAAVTYDEEHGIVLLLPVGPLRELVEFLRVVPTRRGGAIRFRGRPGQVVVEASDGRRAVAGGALPAAIPEHVLARFAPICVPRERLRKLLELHGKGDRIMLSYVPAQGTRTLAREVWPHVLRDARDGAEHVALVGREHERAPRGGTRMARWRARTEGGALALLSASFAVAPVA